MTSLSHELCVGVEVKAGESLKVRPDLFKLIHVSQAAIGEVKDVKEAKHVPLRLTVGENSYVIGTLSAEDRPQLMFDLVFEKEFELSHGWKNGSVYFIGYTADDPSTDEIDSGDDDFSDEENVLEAPNAKLEAEVKEDEKLDALKSAVNAKVAELKKGVDSDEDDSDDSEDDSDDEDDDSEDDSDDAPLGVDGPEGMDLSDDSDDDDDDSEEEEETPKKVEQKKRPAPSPKVAPGSGKKAKQATPDNKSGGKKGPATPFAKQNGKPAFNSNNNKPKAQSPKSGGQFSGNKSNNKNFSGQKNFKGKQGRK